MPIDFEYYRKINGLSGTTDKKDYFNKQITKSLNKSYSNVLSTFEILVNSDRADDILADGVTTRCVFDYSKTSKETKNELPLYTREMWIDVNVVHVGSVIKHTDKISNIENTYLVVSKKEDSQGYDLCYIQKSNNTLKFYSSTLTSDENPILIEIPCIISNKITLGLKENQYMTLPDKTIMVTVPNTSDASQIYEGQKFIIGRNAYKVEGIDDLTQPGLFNIRMSLTQKSESDNVETEVNSTIQNVIETVNSNQKGGW